MKKTSKFQSNIMIFQKEIARLKGILSASGGEGLTVDILKSEHDFLSYVELLKKFAKRYTVMIAASDTPYKRGLNFVVYDKVTRFVLDAVNFDTLHYTPDGNRIMAERLFEELKKRICWILREQVQNSQCRMTMALIGTNQMNLQSIKKFL